jgi:Ca-activated chloride channel family protein
MEFQNRLHPTSENNQKQFIMKTLISSLVALVLAVILSGAGSQAVITGKVTDSTGSALPGVSVVVKGSSRGTVTDYSGSYRIQIQQGDQVLVFACIGYTTKSVKIANQAVINVVLDEDPAELEEVVTVGYASRKEYAQPMVGRIAGYGAQKSMVSDDHYAMPVFNTENYAGIDDNGYKDALKQPLSTFSIDVDRASYSNVRRFLNQGQLPPADAVRIEEMINYFGYDYPKPDGNHPFSVYTELSVCPWNADHQLLHIGLKGKEMDKDRLPASNLVFLIDVSGSMQDYNKLPLLKNAFSLLVKELRPIDRVAIVVYAGAAGLVLESTPGSQKEKILAAIERLEAGGSTAGGEGLKLAYATAGKYHEKGGNSRIILATDGDFNVGPSSNAEMERLVETEREKGIFMTVLGFGMGNYKDDRMEIIADKGNGNYAYIDNIQEARKVMVSEFSGTLFTIAKDVKFQLEFNPARVKAYRLIGYENRLLNDEDFNDDKKDAGEMGAGHTVTALYEIIPAGSKEHAGSIDPLKYQVNATMETVKADPKAELLTVKLRYKQPEGSTSILYEKPVKGEVYDLDATSANFRFSASVAAFGMLLRNSEFKGNASYEKVLNLARGAKGLDEEGYRAEFVQLVRTAEGM